MADSRCFIPCSHPGREHEPDSGGVKAWNPSHLSHRRKFMQFRGGWVDRDSGRCTGDLVAWGEWEPESELVRELDQPGGDSLYPRYLWNPYYTPKDDHTGLHNTDPFIFGERIMYSNCGQAAKPGLKHLGDGSVIAFGSGKNVEGRRRRVLNTVLVVKDSVLYDAAYRLDHWVPEAFMVAMGEMLTRSGRLYLGATPDDSVDGMFSFFPASSAGGTSGFPRPLIDLPPEYFNPRSWQAPKGVRRDRTAGELRMIWESLVSQVRERGLLIGTHASLPERRARGSATSR